MINIPKQICQSSH